MKDIQYTDHLKVRLKARNIPEDYPEKIYKNPERKFFDRVEGNSIAVKKLQYNNKERNMMIAYEEKAEEVEIVTIHPITEEQIIKRIMNRRWIKNE